MAGSVPLCTDVEKIRLDCQEINLSQVIKKKEIEEGKDVDMEQLSFDDMVNLLHHLDQNPKRAHARTHGRTDARTHGRKLNTNASARTCVQKH